MEQVVDGIWWVGGGSWGAVTPVHSVEGSGNMFLVGGKTSDPDGGGKGDFALIDAGIPAGVDAVLANAAAAGAAPGDISTIVVTHSHSDHAPGAPMLRERTGGSIAASALAARAFGGDEEARRILFLRAEPVFRVDRVLEDGDELRAGPYRFRVLLTPGHIPDSVTLAGHVGGGGRRGGAGLKVVFTGDTAIGDQGAARGVVGWLDGHWSSNPKHLKKSLERIMAEKADLMLPGHGLPIRGAGNVRASLEHCIARVEQVLAIPDLHTLMPLDLSD